MAAEGLNLELVQENHVYSTQRGVLRGLHFQIPPHWRIAAADAILNDRDRSNPPLAEVEPFFHYSPAKA